MDPFWTGKTKVCLIKIKPGVIFVKLGKLAIGQLVDPVCAVGGAQGGLDEVTAPRTAR
jgi:hypothetical protein